MPTTKKEPPNFWRFFFCKKLKTASWQMYINTEGGDHMSAATVIQIIAILIKAAVAIANLIR